MSQTLPINEKDTKLFRSICQTLYTPVIGDALQAIGLKQQVLPQSIQPAREWMRLIGRAMPVRMKDDDGSTKGQFGRLSKALDQLQQGEIYVASGGDSRCAYWGDLSTTIAKSRGAAGAIVDGFHRDTLRVLEHDWPVFSRGRFCQHSGFGTQVVDYRCSIEVGGVKVESGDLIFGDLDGIVVIPRRVEAEVIERALEKANDEKILRKAIESGMSGSDAFAKFGMR